MQAGETIPDAHGRIWEVVSIEPIEGTIIQDLLGCESAGLGQEVHVPITRATLRLKHVSS